jgi:hypothetical protein
MRSETRNAMKFRIVLLYDENRAVIGQLTEKVARAYCTRHGYDLSVHRSLWRPDLPPTYSIQEAIAAEMQAHPRVDWFFRLDSDSIIVNQDYRLEDLVGNSPCAFQASSDPNGLCLGVFAVKNTGWSAELLKMLSFLGQVTGERWRDYDQHNTYDQSTLKVLMRHFPRIADGISLLPENLIQNPRSVFSPNAFLMHYWSASGIPMIAAKMQEVIDHGWSRKGFYQWGENWSS